MNRHRNDDKCSWFKFIYNKGEMRDGARYRGRSGIIGYDLKLTCRWSAWSRIQLQQWKENYVLRLAGKRAFSGADPKLTFSFAGDMANKYELDNEQDKNHLLVSFKDERKISANTLLSSDFSMQRGSHDRDMKASFAFWRRFWTL